MLEKVLQEYFNCKRPYNNNGTLSKEGEMAYAKLVNLLYKIDELIGINLNIDELDKLAPSENSSKMLDKNGNTIN